MKLGSRYTVSLQHHHKMSIFVWLTNVLHCNWCISGCILLSILQNFIIFFGKLNRSSICSLWSWSVSVSFKRESIFALKSVMVWSISRAVVFVGFIPPYYFLLPRITHKNCKQIKCKQFLLLFSQFKIQ